MFVTLRFLEVPHLSFSQCLREKNTNTIVGAAWLIYHFPFDKQLLGKQFGIRPWWFLATSKLIYFQINFTLKKILFCWIYQDRMFENVKKLPFFPFWRPLEQLFSTAWIWSSFNRDDSLEARLKMCTLTQISNNPRPVPCHFWNKFFF